MLNQDVSISSGGRPDARSTALSPLPSRDGARAVDPELKARLIRAAAASALPFPDVIPGAAVLLRPVDLPLNSGRKRSAAAHFAMEPFLAATLEETHVAVGPALSGTVRLCAAISLDYLHQHLGSDTGSGVAVPDLCAVPLPDTDAAWSVWFGHHAVYLRTHDGGGCVVDTDCFPDLWRAFDRPPLQVCHGAVPPGIDGYDCAPDAYFLTASVFELDLRPIKRGARDLWLERLSFAIGLSVIAGLAHAAVIYTDARALERTVSDRHTAFAVAARGRGTPLDLSLPTTVLTAELQRRANPAHRSDPFLRLLAITGSSLSDQHSIVFRDLRFDAGVGTLTILVSAPDLAALERAEDALREKGMTVVSGAASTASSGAEMQLILSEAR